MKYFWVYVSAILVTFMISPANAALFIHYHVTGTGTANYTYNADPTQITSGPAMIYADLYVPVNHVVVPGFPLCTEQASCWLKGNQIYAYYGEYRSAASIILNFVDELTDWPIDNSGFKSGMLSDGVLASAFGLAGYYSGTLDTLSVTIISRDQGTAFMTSGFSPIPVLPSVPEPSSWALLIAGFAACGQAMRKRGKLAISLKTE